MYLVQHKKAWPTKDPFVKLVVALVGMSVVDLYCLCLYFDKEKYQNVDIQAFADRICAVLKQRERVQRVLPKVIRNEAIVGKLVHITNMHGETRKQVTPKQRMGRWARGDRGSAVQNNCWICRIHRKDRKYSSTTMKCPTCGTPLCAVHPLHVVNTLTMKRTPFVVATTST